VNFALAQAASRIDEDTGFGKAIKAKPAKQRKKKLAGDG
jgi:hypothetical protein